MSPTGPTVSKFTREQKTGFVFMLFFAVMTVGLGALQLRNTVYGPFVIKPSEKLSLSQTASADEARLKSIDTDKDGLNDWIELNEYITSPYLADSDSDGVDDKTEIDKGSDPLCAEGSVCAYSEALGGGTTTTASLTSLLLGNGGEAYDSLNKLVSDVASSTAVQAQENSIGNAQTGLTPAELEAIINNPDQLRTLILSTGKIDSVVLQSIDNVTLQTMARKLFTTVTTTPVISSPSSTPQ